MWNRQWYTWFTYVFSGDNAVWQHAAIRFASNFSILKYELSNCELVINVFIMFKLFNILYTIFCNLLSHFIKNVAHVSYIIGYKIYWSKNNIKILIDVNTYRTWECFIRCVNTLTSKFIESFFFWRSNTKNDKNIK